MTSWMNESDHWNKIPAPSRTLTSASKSFSYFTHGYVMHISHKCGLHEAELCSHRGQSFSSCAPASPSAPSA